MPPLALPKGRVPRLNSLESDVGKTGQRHNSISRQSARPSTRPSTRRTARSSRKPQAKPPKPIKGLRNIFAAFSLQCRHRAKALMKTEGCTWDKALKQLFGTFDKKGNGKVELGHFSPVASEMLPALNGDQCRHLFMLLDRDGNGVMDLQEFMAIVAEDDKVNNKPNDRHSPENRSRALAGKQAPQGAPQAGGAGPP